MLLKFLIFFFSLFSVVCANTWTRSSDGKIYPPAFENFQIPNKVGQIKVRILQGNDNHPYGMTGIFLPKGYIFASNQLSTVSPEGQNYPLQVKIHNRYADKSIRFAVIVVKIPNAVTGKIYDVALVKKDNHLGGNVPAKIPNLLVEIKASNGYVKTLEASKATIEKPWLDGAILNQTRYFLPVFKGFNLYFDVQNFENGTRKTDVIFHYDNITDTPMMNANYGVKIIVGGKVIADFKDVLQNHHSMWRYSFREGFKTSNITALNMRDMMALNIFPQLDLSYGIYENMIEYDLQKLQQGGNSIQTTGNITPTMPDTGGRDDIGIIPQWTARYLMTSDDRSRYVVLKNGEIAGYIPWHFWDNRTQQPALHKDYPQAWIDGRATIEKNGMPPYNFSNTRWIPDVAHEPSLAYVPYIITGDRYYYDMLKSIYAYNRLATENTQNDPLYRPQYVHQVRGYGWLTRSFYELESVLSDDDPQANYIREQNRKDDEFFNLMFVEGGGYDFHYGEKMKGFKPYLAGELTGALIGYGADSVQENPVFMQDLAALGIGFSAGLGLNDSLKNLVKWQANFVSGRFLQKNNGYPPQYGSVYKFIQYIPDPQGYDLVQGKMKIMNRWQDVFQASIKSGYFHAHTQEIKNFGLAGYPDTADGYAAYARASNAQIFNVTRDPRALEAYGFLAQYFELSEDKYSYSPTYLIMPRFKNNMPLMVSNIVLGNNGNNDLDAKYYYSLLHGGNGDDNLKGKNAFFFGGNGNDKINADEGENYLFGGSGKDTIWVHGGDNILKGDEDGEAFEDVFKFSGNVIGKNVILDFQPNKDKIYLTKDTTIIKYAFNNRLEGLGISKRDFEGTYDPNCADLPKSEQKKRTECIRYLNYLTSHVADMEFFKEIDPEIPQELKEKEQNLREKLKTISREEQPVQYRDAYNAWVHTVQAKDVYITKLLSDSRFGDKSATAKIHPTPIKNIGLENYLRPAPNGGTIIDFDINLTPAEQMERANNKFHRGYILLPNVPIEKIRREDFIFDTGK